jgi:hypothetical protein
MRPYMAYIAKRDREWKARRKQGQQAPRKTSSYRNYHLYRFKAGLWGQEKEFWPVLIFVLFIIVGIIGFCICISALVRLEQCYADVDAVGPLIQLGIGALITLAGIIAAAITKSIADEK